MPFMGEASLPPGVRVYAIGDVHGCLQQLVELHLRIHEDIAARPVDDYQIVHVGDYIDRGPDPVETIEYLIEFCDRDDGATCLYGNHEDWMMVFLEKADESAAPWLTYGGVETLKGYGIDAAGFARAGTSIRQLSERLADAVPARHLGFIRSLPRALHVGDYFFVHAGIRPGRTLVRQETRDLIWIREPFLSDQSDHGAVIVHGHTPVEAVEVKRNRINIDTGAVYGGRLSCVVLEDTDLRFIDV